MLNQTADELSVELFSRGLKSTLEANSSVDESGINVTPGRDRSAKDMGLLRSQSRENTLLRLHESGLDEVDQIRSSQVFLSEDINP